MIGHYGELESKELVLPFQQCLNYCECLPLNCSVVLLGIDQFVWHEPCQSACFSLRPWGSPFSQHTHTYQFWGRIQTSSVAQILLQDVPHALLWCCSKRTCHWGTHVWTDPITLGGCLLNHNHHHLLWESPFPHSNMPVPCHPHAQSASRRLESTSICSPTCQGHLQSLIHPTSNPLSHVTVSSEITSNLDMDHQGWPQRWQVILHTLTLYCLQQG